jgi:hypothetical protein
MRELLEQYNEMLDRGIIPVMEYDIGGGEYLVVRIGVTDRLNTKHQGILFEFDGEGRGVSFDGEIEAIGNGVYLLPYSEYFTSLDSYLEMISENIIEGYLIPNNLYFDQKGS